MVITLGITIWASRQTRNATDFYAGGRSFSGFQNGMAIGGDYMSAASFLGIAGIIALFGYDGFLYSIGFFAWYALYVILSAYARDFMGTKLFGNINVALVLGLLQFASTFIIAWLYARHADRKIDPLADELRARVESGGGVAR